MSTPSNKQISDYLRGRVIKRYNGNCIELDNGDCIYIKPHDVVNDLNIDAELQGLINTDTNEVILGKFLLELESMEAAMFRSTLLDMTVKNIRESLEVKWSDFTEGLKPVFKSLADKMEKHLFVER